MTALDGFFVKREYRNRSLHLLCQFIQSEPPHLHLILQTPLFGTLLQSLQHDDSTSTVSLALASLSLLLPNMPSSLVPFLPTLFNIYARLLFWDRDRSFAQEHTGWGPESPPPTGVGVVWEKSLFDHDLDGNSIPYLSQYFTILYGLYPINFVDYIRKPQRYLRHANNDDDIDVQATEIRDRSERFRQRHTLHPNFYSLTIESEKTDLSRWIKSEAAEVVVECMALCTDWDASTDPHHNATPDPGFASPLPNEAADKDSLDPPLLSRSVGEAPSADDSQSGHLRRNLSGVGSSIGGRMGSSDVMRRSSQSSHRSTGESVENRPREIGSDSPTLPPQLATSSSNTQLQDMMHSNKVIKSGLHQSHANDSVVSLALSHQDANPERHFLQLQSLSQPVNSPDLLEMRSQVALLHRQNLILQIDLNFERYMKQQHIGYVGELRRRQVREAATEAETQNLIMVNRNMKHRLEEAKKAELQVKKESDIRRKMSSKWEADLTAKLKTLREEQKRWIAEQSALKHDLEGARDECESLRKLILDAEEARLKSKQDSEDMDITAEELARLRAEIARLSTSERRYQGKEAQMQSAIQEGTEADARAEMLSIKLATQENQLKQAKDAYESQIAALNKQLAQDIEGRQSTRDSNASVVFESALAASRAKQVEMQKQFSMLMRKYTLLQSSLLDMQVGPNADVTRITESSGVTRGRPHRGFSDPEAFEAASYRATPPLEPVSTSAGAGVAFPGPSTPPTSGPSDPTPAARTSPQSERYHGRGK